MDKVQSSSAPESLSDILYRFSIAISAIKVAKEALGAARIDEAMLDQALTLAINGIDKAYNQLDRAIIDLGKEPVPKTIGDVPDFVFDRLEAERCQLDDARATLLLVEKHIECGNTLEGAALGAAIRQIYSVYEKIDPAVIMERPEVTSHG